jgi:hypothetical protein
VLGVGGVVGVYHQVIRSFGLLFQQADDGPDVISTDPLALSRRITVILVVVVFLVILVRIGRGHFVLVRRRVHVVETGFGPLLFRLFYYNERDARGEERVGKMIISQMSKKMSTRYSKNKKMRARVHLYKWTGAKWGPTIDNWRELTRKYFFSNHHQNNHLKS